MPELHGIDVSYSQGPIPWPTVATTEPDLLFVAARQSHGGRNNGNLRKDIQADANKAGMRAAFPNTPRGYYHFLGASDPQVQADWFYSIVGGLQPGEFVMLDVEEDAAAGIGWLPASHILATLKAISARFGVTCFLYIGLPNPAHADPTLFDFPLWFPAYTTEARAAVYERRMGRKCVVWQWGGGAEGAQPPGFSKRIDSNRIQDFAGFRAALKPAPQPDHTDDLKPAPQPEDFDMAFIIHDTERDWWATVDAGYTTGVDGPSLASNKLPILDVSTAKFNEYTSVSDIKKAADKKAAAGVTTGSGGGYTISGNWTGIVVGGTGGQGAAGQA